MVRILVGNNLTSMSQKCKLKEGEERKKERNLNIHIEQKVVLQIVKKGRQLCSYSNYKSSKKLLKIVL